MEYKLITYVCNNFIIRDFKVKRILQHWWMNFANEDEGKFKQVES